MLQELYIATKPLQQEAERLQEACGDLSSAEFASEPQYRAAAKVHSFLTDHVITCAPVSPVCSFLPYELGSPLTHKTLISIVHGMI